MFKISMVMTATAMFAALLIAGPARLTLTAGSAETAVAFVKVKTITVHPRAVQTEVASFEPSTDKRKPSIRRTSGRLVAWN